MTPFDELQREHEQLLEKADVSDVVGYIDRARTLAAQIGDPRERDQLRANLRYWASYVYDRNGTYPSTTLLPAAIAKSIVPPPEPDKEKRVAAPPAQWRWLIGGALVVVIVVAILLPQFNMMSPTAPSQATPGVTVTIINVTERLRSLPTTTDLYDKPGNEPTAQLLGRLQASSQFYAIARTTDELWLKITTVDAVNGWIKATASGVTSVELGQIPSAAIVIVSSPTATHIPFPTSTAYVTLDATGAAGAGDEPTNQPTPPPTPTRAVQRATPTLAGQYTPTGPIEPPNMLPLQVNYQVVTYGPSPFNAEAWVIEVQLTATGGDNRYVFWVDGQRLEGDRYTVDGVACRAMSFTIGATSGGQAVRRDVTLKSPLPKCQ